MPDIRYTIRRGTAIKSLPDEDIEHVERIPCWTVTRVTGGMGWHVGKYRSREVAEAVALVLTKFVDEELR